MFYVSCMLSRVVYVVMVNCSIILALPLVLFIIIVFMFNINLLKGLRMEISHLAINPHILHVNVHYVLFPLLKR